MARLSDKLSSLTYTPKSQSPARAGTIVQAGTDTITNWTDNGWLECDGSAVSRTTYADLFSNISTKYGVGDGSTTFNLPDGPRRTLEIDLGSFAGFTTSTQTSKAIFSQDALGNWYIDFVITGTTSSSVLAVILDFAPLGINFVWGTGPSDFQFFSGGNSSSNGNWGRVTSATTVQLNGDIAAPSWGSTARLKLTGKPTDSAVSNDGNFSTFDEALESIPMIKAYDDVASVSLSTAAATSTRLGTVKLSSEFAAGNGVYGLVQANKWQIKTVSANVTTNTTFLTFNNLVIGKDYLVDVNLYASVGTSSDTFVNTSVAHDGNNILTMPAACSSGATTQVGVTGKKKFTATSTTMTVATISSASANSYIMADDPATGRSSFVMLTELNNEIVTTDFT